MESSGKLWKLNLSLHLQKSSQPLSEWIAGVVMIDIIVFINLIIYPGPQKRIFCMAFTFLFILAVSRVYLKHVVILVQYVQFMAYLST